MNALDYSHRIEGLYRRIYPSLPFDADSIRMRPQECLEDGLGILCALGIIQDDDVSNMLEQYSFGPYTLSEYIDVCGTSSINDWDNNLQSISNHHLKDN